MYQYKTSIGIILIILGGLSACQKANKTNEGKNQAVPKTDIKIEISKTHSSDNAIPESTPTNEIDTIKIINFINQIPKREIPYHDSTNFDNVLVTKPLTNDLIEFLELKQIFPYDMTEVESIWLRDKVELSDTFISLIFGFYLGDHELYTTLVTYTKDFKLIDYQIVAYDEIAESCNRIESYLGNNQINVFNINFCFEQQNTTDEFIIKSNGEISPKS